MSPVEITQREMFDAITGLTTQVTIMNQKLDTLVGTTGDHEDRIRLLEGRRWPLPVISALLGVAAIGLSVWSLT